MIVDDVHLIIPEHIVHFVSEASSDCKKCGNGSGKEKEQ